MSLALILTLIGIGVVFIALIVFVSMHNHKKKRKLQENLNKYKMEKEDIDKDDRISLPSQTTTASKEVSISSEDLTKNGVFEEVETSNSEAMVEDYIPEDQPIPSIYPKMTDNIDDDPFKNFGGNENFDPFSNNPFENNYMPNAQPKEDEFETFMNEHSYSRKMFNKPLLDKIKKLPPDIRMLLLSNVFDRFDDDKR